MKVRIVPIPPVIDGCQSFEVRFPDGRESVYFHGDDVAGRRLRHDAMTVDQAREAAKEFARKEQDKLDASNPPPG